jgi:hypothetical protein
VAWLLVHEHGEYFLLEGARGTSGKSCIGFACTTTATAAAAASTILVDMVVILVVTRLVVIVIAIVVLVLIVILIVVLILLALVLDIVVLPVPEHDMQVTKYLMPVVTGVAEVNFRRRPCERGEELEDRGLLNTILPVEKDNLGR